MLEQDLDVLWERPEDLPIDIERKEQEVEACYVARVAEEEAIQLQAEIDLQEAISHLGWELLSSDFSSYQGLGIFFLSGIGHLLLFGQLE